MITVSEAIRITREQTQQLPVEQVALSEALGRVLAEEVIADSDLPPFDRAQMDGYAVRSADTVGAPVRLRVVGESAAGRGWHQEMRTGAAVRIMEGGTRRAGAARVQRAE